MHYLVVSPTPIYPANAGNRVVVLSMVRALRAAGHRVSFLYSIQEGIANDAYIGMLRETDALYISNYHQDTLHRDANNRAMIRTNLDRVPLNYEIDDWYDAEIDPLIKEIYTRDPFEVIVSNYIWMSRVFAAVPPHIVKIQQTHDRFSDRMVMLAKLGLPPAFFSVTPAGEAQGLNRADLNIALQYNEEMYFRAISDKPVVTLQYAPEKIPFFKTPLPVGRKLRLGFVGGDNNLNIKTLVGFIELLTAVPAISERVEFCVVGTICKIFAAAPPAFVKLLGYCEDIHKAYEIIDVIVNPMEEGTGLKIKSVDALHYHRPLIMTSVGSDGLLSPYRFHNCANMREVLGFVKMILDNPELLNLMQAAGEKVLNAYWHRLDRAMQALTDPQKTLAGHAASVAPSRVAGIHEGVKDIVPAQGIWIDIGSGDGAFAVAAARDYAAAKIFVFEFEPVLIEQIKSTVIAHKLSDKIDMGWLGFAVGTAQGYGRLAKGKTRSIAVFDDSFDTVPEATVPFLPIDTVFASTSRVDAINIAVENPDQILAALTNIIDKCQPVIFVQSRNEKAALENWARTKNYALRAQQSDGKEILILTPSAKG